MATPVLGDLAFAEVWEGELIYIRLCLGKPWMCIQWRDHLGSPVSNEAVAGSCVALQPRVRMESVAEGQHSALWIMVPRETCPNSTFYNKYQASLPWSWGTGSSSPFWTWHWASALRLDTV